MKITGANFRKIEERKDYSFFSTLSVDSVNGSAYFGFSGESNQLRWDFKSGRVIDPEGNYVYSYQKDKVLSISGDISTGAYSYYLNGGISVKSNDSLASRVMTLNDSLIVQSRSRSDFALQRLIVDATGVGLTFDPQLAVSNSGDFLLTNVDNHIENGVLSNLEITNNGDSLAIEVFTGVVDSTLTGVATIDTSFPFRVSGTTDIFLQGHGDIADGQTYDIPIMFKTTVGELNKRVTLTGVQPPSGSFFNFATGDDSDFQSGSLPVSGGDSDIIKTGFYSLNAGILSGSTSLDNYPVKVELTYSQGRTGLFEDCVTGVNINNEGSGYNENLIVSFQGGSPTSGAEATGNLNIVEYFYTGNSGVSSLGITEIGEGYSSTPDIIFYQNLINIDITSGGSGYTGVPDLVFSGASGSGASATAVTGIVSGTQTGITSITLVNSGSGYVGAPEIIVSGATGASAILASAVSIMSSGASATALTGSFTKSFTGQFDLLTGLTNLTSYRDNSFYTGTPPTGYTNSEIEFTGNENTLDIQVTYKTTPDTGALSAFLFVSGTGSNTYKEFITGVR